MVGINADTGEVLGGFAHVEQSIDILITTMLSERVMREWVGNPGTKLLGETASEKLVIAWVTIIWALIELFEPRFKITRFQPNDITRPGSIDFTILGSYRPYAQLNWSQAELFVSITDGVVKVTSGR